VKAYQKNIRLSRKGKNVRQALNLKVPEKPNANKHIHVYVLDKKQARIPTAYGLCGLAPETAEAMGTSPARILEPKENLRGGIRKFGGLLALYDGDVTLALAAYNAGEGNIEKFGNEVPKIEQTKNYVQRVKELYAKLKSS
jgi:hypothetical protein